VSSEPLRVAFFPDAYHEIDGVANTSRHFESFAMRKGLPFLTILGGSKNSLEIHGSITRMQRRRGRVGFPLDKKHDFDLLFWRHYNVIENAVRQFDPDILHVTGPSDNGQLGAMVAHRMRIPLAASWHTNLHQYAEQRASRLMFFLPPSVREKAGAAIREASLLATLRFYKIAQILYAPNQELIELLERGTGKPCYPMPRGVDTQLFNPARRERTDNTFVLGYVGRLSTEKNVRYLADIERGLLQAGVTNFRFLIVGQGVEDSWLKANLLQADFTGVLHGEALARAYAGMDVFVFPSLTDTYGNVVLEAMSAGVPAIVTNRGGPQFIVQPGVTGYVARNLSEFIDFVRTLSERPEHLSLMRIAARNHALSTSWDRTFESVYANYDRELKKPHDWQESASASADTRGNNTGWIKEV
jgi:glycosyltransferase involved in cell wall biosynthesis